MFCPICGSLLTIETTIDPNIGLVGSNSDCPQDCYSEEYSFGAYRIYVGTKCFDLGYDKTNRAAVRNAITILRQERRNGYPERSVRKVHSDSE
jgi:hypothetical protein